MDEKLNLRKHDYDLDRLLNDDERATSIRAAFEKNDSSESFEGRELAALVYADMDNWSHN